MNSKHGRLLVPASADLLYCAALHAAAVCCATQRLHAMQRELCLAKMESEQLKLDGLRQRKQNSILRLKLASAKEDADLLQRNVALLNQHSNHLVEQVAGLKDSLAAATQQLTAVSAAKAVSQAEAAKHQVGATHLHKLVQPCTTQANQQHNFACGTASGTALGPAVDGHHPGQSSVVYTT